MSEAAIRRQVFGREAPILVGKQAARLAQPRTVERVAHTARVGEVRLADASGQVLFKGLARAGSETVAVLARELIGDAQQLRGRNSPGKSRWCAMRELIPGLERRRCPMRSL